MSAYIRFLPRYMGSKIRWLKYLEQYKGRDFVEFFAGSASISANLAKRAVLNDLDPILHKYFCGYADQPVLGSFSDDDFYRVREQPDWLMHLYYLQRMVFSGVYNYNKCGLYNGPLRDEYLCRTIDLSSDIRRSIARFVELDPVISNFDYADILIPDDPDVAVLDPPYEGKQAGYNKRTDFDYDQYWVFVQECIERFQVVIVFDTTANLRAHGFSDVFTKNTRVCGHHTGDVEGVYVHDKRNCSSVG